MIVELFEVDLTGFFVDFGRIFLEWNVFLGRPLDWPKLSGIIYAMGLEAPSCLARAKVFLPRPTFWRRNELFPVRLVRRRSRSNLSPGMFFCFFY